MFNDILFAIWFFLPAGIANMTPILAAKIPYLRTLSFPLDCYLTFRQKRIFGGHKTVRGMLSGILLGTLIVYLQVALYAHVPFVRTFVTLDYSTINPLLLGLLSSVGALSGDAIRSFFKRQRGLSPGKSWFPFDQVDYIVGGVVCTALYLRLTFVQYILLFLIWFVVHPVATFIGYHLKLKESPI